MTNAAQSLILDLETVVVKVSDLNKSKKWYKEKLGLTVLKQDKIMKLIHMGIGTAHIVTLWEFNEVQFNGENPSCYPVFSTSDALTLRRSLTAKGVNVSDIFWNGEISFFRFMDPDGNVLNASQIHRPPNSKRKHFIY